MRLLVTGASGMLGKYVLRQAGPPWVVFPSWKSHRIDRFGGQGMAADLTVPSGVETLFRQAKPDIVLHAAAMTDVEQCEEDPQGAWIANVKATEWVSRSARAAGAKLAYVSTDAVHDGNGERYSEEASTAPVNVYARTKLEAEEVVRRSRCNWIVFRGSFFGLSTEGRGLAEWILGRLRADEPLAGFTDVFFSPLYASTFVDLMLRAIARNLTGVYNLASRDACSKFEFARQLAQAAGYSDKNIYPVPLESIRLRAKRPKNTTLSTERLVRDLQVTPPSIQEEIEQLVDDLRSEADCARRK